MIAGKFHRVLCVAVWLALPLLANAGQGDGKALELTLDRAVQLALAQNPNVLNAVQEIRRTRGLVVEVRAQALPQVGLKSVYNETDPRLVGGSGGGGEFGGSVSVSPGGGTPGGGGNASFKAQNKAWQVTVEAKQVIYSGGQVRAALDIAKFTQDSSYYSLRDTIEQTVADVRSQFYNVLVNRSLITVQEESITLLEQELKDQQDRFEAGTVPRFNVLRAEVELANAQPDLIKARNDTLIAQLRLARTLGISYSRTPAGVPPVNAVGELEVQPLEIDLGAALATAKERRAFLKVQRQQILIEAEQIKVALAGYKPKLDVNGGYELANSRISTDLGETVNGWFFGVTGTWDIFDGLETSGKVTQARAKLQSAKITYDDSVLQVEMEVEEAYAKLREAEELLQGRQKNIEQALESLRLARDRLDAGAGTQLDLLDARVALTRARVTELQARYDYNVAMAEFDRVTGADTQFSETFADPLSKRGKPVDWKRIDETSAKKAQRQIPGE